MRFWTVQKNTQRREIDIKKARQKGGPLSPGEAQKSLPAHDAFLTGDKINVCTDQ